MSFFADYFEVKQLDNAESEHRMISKALIEQETKVLIRKYGRTREIYYSSRNKWRREKHSLI
ncbi:protein of unknown function (plasmid) [Leuconostoc carnosum]|nr:protein of unknown function [Leuconostoc carnosum]